jgi:glycosyltransferase involved in cell wall biosynthesis
MILSLLIPTIADRREMFENIYSILKTQILKNQNKNKIEILVDNSNNTIGAKRNNLLEKSKGEYIAFIDDDDEVSSDYIDSLMNSIKSKPDCVSLRGVITWNGSNPELFEHSVKYTAYATTTNEIKYERYPNHLNCIKSSIAKQFKFKEINFGEDTDWATQIFQSGLLKKEVYIDKVLYHYKYIVNK